MPVNRIRGLYRFCWAIAIFLSALMVGSFYDRTTEPSGYEPKFVRNPPPNWQEMRTMSVQEVGTLFIPKWIPPDPDIELKLAEQCRELADGEQASFVASEVYSVNWLKMLGLVFGAISASVLATRATAGTLVWIARTLGSVHA